LKVVRWDFYVSKPTELCVISGFRYGVNEIFPPLLLSGHW